MDRDHLLMHLDSRSGKLDFYKNLTKEIGCVIIKEN